MAERPTTPNAVYAARPTVRVDSQEFPLVTELLQAMQMTEHEGGMSALELTLSNVASNPEGGAAYAFEDDRILKLGARITVYAGDASAPHEIFQGTITGIEAEWPPDDAPSLTVLAEDVFQRARMVRRTKIHDTATVAGLARELANQLGLTPVVDGLSESIGTQVQLNESDLAFVRRLLARYDGEMQVVGTELHVSPRSDVQRGTVELRMHSQLHRARVLADLAHQVTEVTVGGWDAAQGQRASGTSTGANLGPGTGRRGADVLRDALGARSHHVAHLAIQNETEARAVADAAFDGRARRFVVVDGTAEGNASLRVGTQVTLRGLGRRFDNTYAVTTARHRFDQLRGYETDFTAECAYWGNP